MAKEFLTDVLVDGDVSLGAGKCVFLLDSSGNKIGYVGVDADPANYLVLGNGAAPVGAGQDPINIDIATGQLAVPQINYSGNTTITGLVSMSLPTGGNNNNINPGTNLYSILSLTGTAAATVRNVVTGIVAGLNSQVIVIKNNGIDGTNSSIVLSHEDTNSTAGNRISTSNGRILYLPYGEYVTFIYDGSVSRWVQLTFPKPFSILATTTIPAGNTISNTNTATTFSTVVTVPPSVLCGAGQVLRVRAHGTMSTAAAAPTLNISGLFGANTLFQTGATSLPASLGSGTGWGVDLQLVVQSFNGTSITADRQGLCYMGTTLAPIAFTSTAGYTSINRMDISLRVQWSAAAAANSITLRQLTATVENP